MCLGSFGYAKEFRDLFRFYLLIEPLMKNVQLVIHSFLVNCENLFFMVKELGNLPLAEFLWRKS